MFEKLKELIAGTLKIKASDINDDFSLKTGRFKTSAGSVILGNIVRKVSGQQVDCRNVNTFGELKGLLGADAQPTQSVEETPAVEQPAAEPAPEVMTEMKTTLICGIDIQEIDIFPDVADFWAESFYTDNFTPDEIAYCVTTASPRHSFAGRWCVKEALHKCGEKFFNIPLRDIQISKRANGLLKIEIISNGEWKELALSCSISHADKYAVGMVTGFEV